MKPEEETTEAFDQPVAYDAEGRPLYAHPQQATPKPIMAQVVHLTRPTEPEKPFISDATKIKHDRSVKLYPTLNLSEGEYVISAVRRHPIGLFIPVGLGVLLLGITLSVLFNYDAVVVIFGLTGAAADPAIAMIPLLLFVALIGLMTYIAYYVYISNRFFLTNESVIQEIQTTLLAMHEQTVSLGNIEDASYEQAGILQQLFNYGSIRLSTEGDETTYRFNYVANPKQHIATLNDAVESFKNGRPVNE